MIPLYDHESEKWLIGALLTDAEVQKQLPTLPADLMHDPLNEKILSCMRRLQERREPIEPLSVQGTLRDAGEPDMAEYLIGCMRFAVSGASAGHYIARLRGLFRARSAYAMASDFCRRLRCVPLCAVWTRHPGASCAWTSWPAAYTTMWNGGPAAK